MQNNTQEVKVTFANPSALGLFGLAMVTLVASTQKLGITEGLSYVLPWAFFLGGAAQLIAAIGDFKRDNAFGATVFGAYGLFWFAVGTSWMMNMGVFGTILKDAVDTRQLGYAFVGYLIFTAFMTIGATKTSKVLFSIFVLIDVLFLGLSLSTLKIMPEFGHMLASWSELAISLLSFYCLAGTLLNPMFGKELFPLGKPLK